MDKTSTVFDNLQAIAHKDASAAARLRAPPLSRQAQVLRRIYEELAAQRFPTGFGAAPIQDFQITAWERRNRVRLARWQVDIMRAMERTAREALEDQSADGGPAEPRNPPRVHHGQAPEIG